MKNVMKVTKSRNDLCLGRFVDFMKIFDDLGPVIGFESEFLSHRNSWTFARF